MLGLVLTAGGARGAYQAGVLKRIGEIPGLREAPSPFAIVTGASAGAINGAAVAAGSASLHDATRQLAALWCQLEVEQVFRTDALSLGLGAFGLLRGLALGGLFGRTVTQALFDTTPLRELLARALPLDGITEAIRVGHLYAIAVSATSYHSGRSFTFVQGRPGHPVWQKSRRVVLPVELTVDHVCASAAIPIVFPPVRVRSPAGDLYFADGALPLVPPFRPATRPGGAGGAGGGGAPPAARRPLAGGGGGAGGGGRRRGARAPAPAAGADLRRVPERHLLGPPRRRPRPSPADERAHP